MPRCSTGPGMGRKIEALGLGCGIWAEGVRFGLTVGAVTRILDRSK